MMHPGGRSPCPGIADSLFSQQVLIGHEELLEGRAGDLAIASLNDKLSAVGHLPLLGVLSASVAVPSLVGNEDGIERKVTLLDESIKESVAYCQYQC